MNAGNGAAAPANLHPLSHILQSAPVFEPFIFSPLSGNLWLSQLYLTISTATLNSLKFTQPLTILQYYSITLLQYYNIITKPLSERSPLITNPASEVYRYITYVQLLTLLIDDGRYHTPYLSLFTVTSVLYHLCYITALRAH